MKAPSLTLALCLGAGLASAYTSVKLHPGSVPLVEDPDYHSWVIEDGATSSSFSVNGLNFTLSAATGRLTGGAIDGVYTSPLPPDVKQRLVGSAITTEAEHGSIKLSISGLTDRHKFYFWFNAYEHVDRPGSVRMDANTGTGGRVRSQSSQATSWYEAVVGLIITNGEAVEITLSSYGNIQAGNIYLSGFDLDPPYNDLTSHVRRQSPALREEDVKAPGGELIATWEWTRAEEFMLSTGDDIPFEHNVWLGTSSDDMQQVVSEQLERTATFTGLESGTTYYWRVDTRETFVTPDNPYPWHEGRLYWFTVA